MQKYFSKPFLVILIDEVEDFEEEDLNCEGEMDHYPSWEIDSDAGANVDLDCEAAAEDTALLQQRSHTKIIITSVTPVNIYHHFQLLIKY